jgi:hypothetical protein
VAWKASKLMLRLTRVIACMLQSHVCSCSLKCWYQGSNLWLVNLSFILST